MNNSTMQKHRAVWPVELIDQLQCLRAGGLFDIDTKRDRVAEVVR